MRSTLVRSAVAGWILSGAVLCSRYNRRDESSEERPDNSIVIEEGSEQALGTGRPNEEVEYFRDVTNACQVQCNKNVYVRVKPEDRMGGAKAVCGALGLVSPRETPHLASATHYWKCEKDRNCRLVRQYCLEGCKDERVNMQHDDHRNDEKCMWVHCEKPNCRRSHLETFDNGGFTQTFSTPLNRRGAMNLVRDRFLRFENTWVVNPVSTKLELPGALNVLRSGSFIGFGAKRQSKLTPDCIIIRPVTRFEPITLKSGFFGVGCSTGGEIVISTINEHGRKDEKSKFDVHPHGVKFMKFENVCSSHGISICARRGFMPLVPVVDSLLFCKGRCTHHQEAIVDDVEYDDVEDEVDSEMQEDNSDVDNSESPQAPIYSPSKPRRRRLESEDYSSNY